MLWVRVSVRARCTTLCDKVCQWLTNNDHVFTAPLWHIISTGTHVAPLLTHYLHGYTCCSTLTHYLHGYTCCSTLKHYLHRYTCCSILTHYLHGYTCCSILTHYLHAIFVSFGGTLFQQVVGIPMGTNCFPLLADLFLYSYESGFLQKLVKDKKIHEARAFNFTYRYIDDVLSINNSRFAEFLPLIYPPS